MIFETWKCDKQDCGSESEPVVLDTAPPFGWVEVTRFGCAEGDDQKLHYCGWECALHGVNQALTISEQEEAERETH